MVILHYWGLDIFGHAAVQAGNEYLSFHPEHRDKIPMRELVGVTGRFEDCSIELGDPRKRPHSVTSRTLDEGKIAKRIAELKAQDPKYCFLTNNCSHIAMRALAAGMSDDDRRLANTLIGGLDGMTGKSVAHVGTIDQIVDFVIEAAPKMWPALARARAPTQAVATVVAGLSGLKRAAITSPADVVRFVQAH
jgi:hypothetical protein